MMRRGGGEVDEESSVSEPLTAARDGAGEDFVAWLLLEVATRLELSEPEADEGDFVTEPFSAVESEPVEGSTGVSKNQTGQI